MKKILIFLMVSISLVCLAGCGNNQKEDDSSQANDQISKQDENDMMRSFAKTFGIKPVKKLQKEVGSVYSSKKVGKDTVYGWEVGNMIFYRVDSPRGTTTVYCLKDGDKAKYHKNGFGVRCYEGQTVKN